MHGLAASETDVGCKFLRVIGFWRGFSIKKKLGSVENTAKSNNIYFSVFLIPLLFLMQRKMLDTNKGKTN